MADPGYDDDVPETDEMFDFLDGDARREARARATSEPAARPVIRAPVPVEVSGALRPPAADEPFETDAPYDPQGVRVDRTYRPKVPAFPTGDSANEPRRGAEARRARARLEASEAPLPAAAPAPGRTPDAEPRVEFAPDEDDFDFLARERPAPARGRGRGDAIDRALPYELDDDAFAGMRRGASESTAGGGGKLRLGLGLAGSLLVLGGAWFVVDALRGEAPSGDESIALAPATGPAPDVPEVTIATRPSLGDTFRRELTAIEDLVGQGRSDEALAALDALDPRVYGYGAREFDALRARIAGGDVGAGAEEPPLAEQQRLAEERRLAEQGRLADEQSIAEERRIAEAERAAQAEAERVRVAEARARAAEEAAARAEREAAELAAAEAEAARAAELERLAEAAQLVRAEREAAVAAAAEREAAARDRAAREAAAQESARAEAAAQAEAERFARERQEAEERAERERRIAAAERETREAAEREAVEARAARDRAEAVERARQDRESLRAREEQAVRARAEQRARDRAEAEALAAADARAAARAAPTPPIMPIAPAPEPIARAPDTQAPTPGPRTIGDADLEQVYGRFRRLEAAIEARDIGEVIALTDSSPGRVQQLMQAFANASSIDASIAGVATREAAGTITGTLRIDTMRRADGTPLAAPADIASITLTSRRSGSGWSAIDW